MAQRIGQHKASVRLSGIPLLVHVVARLRLVFDNILVLGDSTQLPSLAGVEVVADTVRNKGPLGGLFTGLLRSETERNFVCACDMPYLNPRLIQALLFLSSESDVTVPVVRGFIEPLHAVYSKRCLDAIEGCLSRQALQLKQFYSFVCVRRVPQTIVLRTDPQLKSFLNINTEADLRSCSAQQIITPTLLTRVQSWAAPAAKTVALS